MSVFKKIILDIILNINIIIILAENILVILLNMKTEQIMFREEGFIQRISDGYFNATKLIDAWNESSHEKKLLGNYMKNSSTTEFVAQLKSEGIESPIITGRGKGPNSGTWVHPKVFIDLAMWVSVEFKSKVIDYVIDGLIKSRHDAGDYYNEMCKAILETYVDYYKVKPPAHIYIEEANMIKSMVSFKDRNNMTSEELKQLTYLQKFNAMLIRKRIGKESRIRQLTQAAEVIIYE